MAQAASDESILEQILELLSKRTASYEVAVQTTVYWKAPSGAQNLLTKFEFVAKGGKSPRVVIHEYTEIVIVRRLLSNVEVATLLKDLVRENLLDVGFKSE